MYHGIKNDSGFSIIEVLIGAVVFMIGFGSLILMLNNVFLKFSVKELETANNLGQSLMVETTVGGDTTRIDSTIVSSGMRMKVVREISVNENLLAVDVTVTRESTGKEIVRLYNEVLLPEK